MGMKPTSKSCDAVLASQSFDGGTIPGKVGQEWVAAFRSKDWDGYLMGFYSVLMGFYSDLIGY